MATSVHEPEMTDPGSPPGKRPFYRPGPGALVTAAFIGPGTIATCSVAGARFGFALLWGLVFSVIATVVLQEMAARLGVMTQQGLGEALRKHFHKALPRAVTAILVISAIAIGNAAFEAGNILGATLGLESLGAVQEHASAGEATAFAGRLWVVLIGIITFVVLFSGSYKLIERVLVVLVILMSLTFFTTAIFVQPGMTAVLKGMFVPSIPDGALLAVVGLIGTTVVPYNLFLYASAVQKRFSHPSRLPEARRDITVSVILGGIISMAIVVSAAMAFYGNETSPSSGSDLALQLEPLLGSWSRYFIGVGLFSAGISSAITAPLAAAWATAGVLGWGDHMRSLRFRSIWFVILLAGLVFAVLGFRPIEVIIFAQAANGILLPVIAIYLLWVMNSKKVMGSHTNGWLSNILGTVVVMVTLMLSIRSLMTVFGII
ncbi:MAG: Nramp family divalent metal transporter [Bacteroidales bacterium]